jgi:hypothetical protein
MILDLARENLGVRCYDVRWALVNYAHHALNRQGILHHLLLSPLFWLPPSLSSVVVLLDFPSLQI